MSLKCSVIQVVLINYNKVRLSLVLPDVGKVPEDDLGPMMVENGHNEGWEWHPGPISKLPYRLQQGHKSETYMGWDMIGQWDVQAQE